MWVFSSFRDRAFADRTSRVAGTDTTSISLSYFLWELTRRQDILRKLRDEIDAVMPDPGAIPDIKILNGMEYLNAFIKEGKHVSVFPS
jgi:cytochrome P450